MIKDEIIQACQESFKRHFAAKYNDEPHTHVEADSQGHFIIVVDDHFKRAFYDAEGELIKVINLTGDL